MSLGADTPEWRCWNYGLSLQRYHFRFIFAYKVGLTRTHDESIVSADVSMVYRKSFVFMDLC